MKTTNILEIVASLDKYPIEIIFIKEIILSGIDTETKLIDLLNSNKNISQPMRVKLHNAFRDITVSKLYDINKIPRFLTDTINYGNK